MKSTPSIATPAAVRSAVRRAVAPVIETLENRQLLSLTVDLRLPGGAKTANVASVGQVINLEVWATAKGSDASGANESLQTIVGSLLSTNANGGAANGTLKVTAAAPFNGFASQAGKQQDLDADGDLDVGSNANDDATPLFVARANEPNEAGAVSGNSRSWKITAPLRRLDTLLRQRGRS